MYYGKEQIYLFKKRKFFSNQEKLLVHLLLEMKWRGFQNNHNIIKECDQYTLHQLLNLK